MSLFCLGNFDGVHPGHLWLIAQARALSEGAAVKVLTFDPHPRRFFAADPAPFCLTSAAQRASYLCAAGVREVVTVPFNAGLAALSAEEFVRAVLKDQLGVSAVVAGKNFRFGQGRGGDMDLMAVLGRKLGFAVHGIDLHQAGGQPCSSSRIRRHLADGAYREASALWGRNFVVQGTVRQGDHLGRTLGFPTANLEFGAYLRPAFGVYASRATLPDGRVLPSVSNLGRRPTLDGLQDRFETHIFDANEDLYGQVLSVELTDRIRAEQKFAGLDALKAQIAKDCQTARALLGHLSTTDRHDSRL